jgi:hypothetical protein
MWEYDDKLGTAKEDQVTSEQPHQLGLSIPLRSIAIRLCGAFAHKV